MFQSSTPVNHPRYFVLSIHQGIRARPTKFPIGYFGKSRMLLITASPSWRQNQRRSFDRIARPRSESGVAARLREAAKLGSSAVTLADITMARWDATPSGVSVCLSCLCLHHQNSWSWTSQRLACERLRLRLSSTAAIDFICSSKFVFLFCFEPWKFLWCSMKTGRMICNHSSRPAHP